ncbi:MAG: hypothetical protein ACR2NM_05215 [Bythopirellula sp.]
MPRSRKFGLSIALITIVFVGYFLASRYNPPPIDQGSENLQQATTRNNLTEPTHEFSPENLSKESLDAEFERSDKEADCISMEQLESDPVIAAEFARFDSLVTSGPTIESYRSLSSDQLHNLATQGDSAAMAVLGAVEVMRAMALPESKAVAYLLHEETSLESYDFEQPVPVETIEHLEAASAWFYKSAVHGRLLALQSVGVITAIVGGTPFELGWIPQDEYENLEAFEKHALDPTNVYGALAFEIAPELSSGPLGTMTAELTPGGDRQQLLLHELAWQFTQDREAAKLPPIDIPVSTAPSMEEIESLLCEQSAESAAQLATGGSTET